MLRKSYNKWLWAWTAFFGGILAVIGIALWLSVKSLIADRVEKSLNGFKDAVAQQEVIKNQLVVLEKEHAISVLENAPESFLRYEHFHTEQIKALREEVLLHVFGDETRLIEIRYSAADVLAVRKSPRLVSSVLEFVNSVVDSDFDWETSSDTQGLPYRLVNFVW